MNKAFHDHHRHTIIQNTPNADDASANTANEQEDKASAISPSTNATDSMRNLLRFGRKSGNGVGDEYEDKLHRGGARSDSRLPGGMWRVARDPVGRRVRGLTVKRGPCVSSILCIYIRTGGDVC